MGVMGTRPFFFQDAASASSACASLPCQSIAPTTRQIFAAVGVIVNARRQRAVCRVEQTVFRIDIGLQCFQPRLLEPWIDNFGALQILRHRDHRHPLATFCRERIERRHFGDARRAPCRPQIDEQRAPAKIRQRHRRVVGAAKGRRRSRVAFVAAVDHIFELPDALRLARRNICLARCRLPARLLFPIAARD
uniref:Uncharacterized protein n=1 Tax=uncultured bacterium TB321_p TaxID=1552144 RepID=A0A0K0LBK6_9BACT|nr:hypothetical protein [uncultured bacterium TB321_p]